MAGMVVVVARWWSTSGVAPFLLVILHSMPDECLVLLNAVAACVLKLRLSSFQTPRARICCYGTTLVSYILTPVAPWLYLLVAVIGKRCISSPFAGENLMFSSPAPAILVSSHPGVQSFLQRDYDAFLKCGSFGHDFVVYV